MLLVKTILNLTLLNLTLLHNSKPRRKTLKPTNQTSLNPIALRSLNRFQNQTNQKLRVISVDMKTTLQKIVWLTFHKKKIKDSFYYAQKAQEMAENEKAFVTTVSRNVEGYWSPGDDDDMTTGRNICLMARQTV